MKKIYVGVIERRTAEGRLIPLRILWDNGKTYEVDKVLEVRRAASLKVGGRGMRYLCRIQNRQTYLFLEDGRWFVEGK